jgi:hypothetical protein
MGQKSFKDEVGFCKHNPIDCHFRNGIGFCLRHPDKDCCYIPMSEIRKRSREMRLPEIVKLFESNNANSVSNNNEPCQ